MAPNASAHRPKNSPPYTRRPKSSKPAGHWPRASASTAPPSPHIHAHEGTQLDNKERPDSMPPQTRSHGNPTCIPVAHGALKADTETVGSHQTHNSSMSA